VELGFEAMAQPLLHYCSNIAQHSMSSNAPSSMFPRTRWTLVARLRENDAPGAVQAWDELCRAYRRPVLDYLRRHHPTQDEAEDLAQEFFCVLVQKELLRDVSSGKGRLRAWLLLLLKRFMLNAQAHAQAQKRGGHLEKVSLDRQPEVGGGAASNPEWEVIFDRQWAFALIERVFARLREEHGRPAQLRTFDALRPLLLHLPQGGLAKAAAELAMTEGAAKVALHRLRQRFGGVLREEVAATVGSDTDVEDELRHLLRVISVG
jgi:DNA-directed RNA polymerase specialized sigma24 family protein